MGKRNPFKGSTTVAFTSKSGKPIKGAGGRSSASVGVYTMTDLTRRLEAAANDPDITVTVTHVK